MITKILEIEEYLSKKMSELEKKGTSKKELLKIEKRIFAAIKDEYFNELELKEALHEFMTARNNYGDKIINSIAASITVSDNIKILISGGEVDEKSYFDIASVTKFYLLLLVFILEEKGYFNLNEKINDIDNSFDLGDFTILDLVKMHGEIVTDGIIKHASSKEEALKILKTARLISNDRTNNKYTDIGAIILSKIIEEAFLRKENQALTYSEIMDKFIFKKYDLKNTTYNTNNIKINGSGSNDSIHDPKAKILGPVGSAGIVTTIEDLIKLSKLILNREIISEENLKKCGEKIFENSNKGYMGLYQKQEGNLEKTYTPSLFANGSFSHQGWTGAVIAIDPTNEIQISILPDAISKATKVVHNDKADGFKEEFLKFEESLAEASLILKIFSDYMKEKGQEIKIEKQIKL